MRVHNWIDDLVAAVNRDNDQPTAPVPHSHTLATLATAPEALRSQTDLAAADFAAAAHESLEMLRSDRVAADFRVVGGGDLNALIARMTVPGGPWPGHYGLEALAFTATPVTFPDWFPHTGAVSTIHFGEVVATSNGFARGQGAVLFPELLSVRARGRGQAFGVVFLDRLIQLFADRVAPVLRSLQGPVYHDHDSRATRALAFAAHEWGHLSGPIDYEATVLARRQRPVAIISELHADLSALAMLTTIGSQDALAAAQTLLFDRIIREAWLPRAHAQVDSIAARHLLTLLQGTNFLSVETTAAQLHLDRAWPRLIAECERVREVEIRCADGDVAPAQQYLTGFGWQVDDRGCYRQTDMDHASAELQQRSLDQLARL